MIALLNKGLELHKENQCANIGCCMTVDRFQVLYVLPNSLNKRLSISLICIIFYIDFFKNGKKKSESNLSFFYMTQINALENYLLLE